MSIYWDKRNKRYRFEFDRHIEGRRHRANRLLPKGWSQAQADAFDRSESARLYAIATGVGGQDPLIETAVKLYLQDKTHLKSYKGAAEHLAIILPHYRGKPMSELPGIARAIAAEPLAPATNRNRIALLKAACRWAWKQHNLTPYDPTARMQLPTVRNERHVYVSRAQMLRLARATQHRDVRALIRIAFYTGMRLGEIQRAEVAGGMLVIPDTKNGERRAVPVHPRIRVCLRYVPLETSKSNIEYHYRQARVKAGLPHVNIHDLRHSAASEMINAGVDLYTVGTVLGHKDARSTKRYSHLNAATLQRAVNAIGGQKSPHNGVPLGTKKAA
jgi:integrase